MITADKSKLSPIFQGTSLPQTARPQQPPLPQRANIAARPQQQFSNTITPPASINTITSISIEQKSSHTGFYIYDVVENESGEKSTKIVGIILFKKQKIPIYVE